MLFAIININYIVSVTSSPSPRFSIRNINPTLPKPHYPLPPLSKVRCCHPKKFGRLPEGLPHHHPSLAPTLPIPHYPLPRTTSLPCSLLPLHPILPFPQPLQKDNNPSLSTTSLPPLSKVRCCHPKKFGRLPEGLLYTHQPFQNRTIPPTFRRVRVCVCLYGFVSALSLAQYHVLASLVKGEVLSPEKIRATTGGIAIPSPPSMRFSALLYS